MKTRLILILIAATSLCTSVHGTVYTIAVSNPETWVNTSIAARAVGDTVQFNVPLIVNRNYGYGGYSGLTVGVRRVYSATNQAKPGSAEYSQLATLNTKATFSLTDCGYHRNGERLLNMRGVVTGNLKVRYLSGTWAGNGTRAAIEHNVPSVDLGETPHNLLVCGANLEYYLVQNLGTGFGPDDNAEHQKQRTKVKKALAEIHADLYGLVEIEQGQAALAEIASDLTAMTGDPYDYVNDGGVASGSYTKSGYVYRSDRLQPIGLISRNNTVVRNRKMAQGFILLENNERFIYSINHFKAKSGSGQGKDADQGDGQGIFNYSRVQEAKSLLQNMPGYQSYYEDNDVLVMGDLNAYAKEDPIRTLIEGGMYDLHREFHQDSSYSYVYGEQAGYLDHALANRALLGQVTGMAAWHVNSDESDEYTYDKSNDQTVFRYSDHDPVLVGLRLDSTKSVPTHVVDLIERVTIDLVDGSICLESVGELGEQNAYYEIFNITGERVQGLTPIDASPCPINTEIGRGIYLVRIYYAGKVKTLKFGNW